MNLIPNNERSPEELREMGRKGGIKSGESRRRKRDLQKAARQWFDALGSMDKTDLCRLEEILKNLRVEK